MGSTSQQRPDGLAERRGQLIRHRAVLVGILLCLAGADAKAELARGWTDAAKRDATRMFDAYRRNDLPTIIKYTYPGLLKVMGGSKQMLVVLGEAVASMKREGYTFRTATAGTPVQTVTAGSELHAIVPLKQILTAPGGELHVDGYLLAVSTDRGKSWTFVDAAQLAQTSAAQIFPTFNSELRIPPTEKPRFVKK